MLPTERIKMGKTLFKSLQQNPKNEEPVMTKSLLHTDVKPAENNLVTEKAVNKENIAVDVNT